jgi:hypothetical protein
VVGETRAGGSLLAMTPRLLLLAEDSVSP